MSQAQETSMPTSTNAARQRSRRRRIEAAGEQEVMFKLSNDTIAAACAIAVRFSNTTLHGANC
jgi:hypothetical protein